MGFCPHAKLLGTCAVCAAIALAPLSEFKGEPDHKVARGLPIEIGSHTDPLPPIRLVEDPQLTMVTTPGLTSFTTFGHVIKR